MNKILTLIAIMSITFGYSQETETVEEFKSTIPTTDRGTYTKSGSNINRGLQIELGTNYEWLDSEASSTTKSTVYSPIEGLVRWGLGDKVELDFAISNRQLVNRAWDESSTDKYNYWSPLDVGIRTQFVDSKKKCGTEASIYVGLSVYTTQRHALDDNGVRRPYVLVERPTYVAPEFALLMNNNLGKRVELGTNFGLKWTGMVLDTEATSKNPDIFYTVRLLVHASKSFDMYAEHFNYMRKDYYSTLGFNAGMRYAVSRKFVLDINGGLGLNSISPDAFAGLGLSYKLGK